MLALFTERSRVTACQSTSNFYVMDHPVNNIGAVALKTVRRGSNQKT